MSSKVLLAIEAMSHVTEMADAAAAHGYRLVVLAEDPGMYTADSGAAEIVAFPTRDTQRLRDYVKQWQGDIENVFSVTDTWGVQASELRDEFGFPQFMNTDKLRTLRDKAQVDSKLRAADWASTGENSITFPCIIKPRDGTGKIDVRLIQDADALDQLAQTVDLEDYVRQPYHQGPVYSAEVWADDSQYKFMGVTNRILSRPPRFLELAKSFPWAAGTAWERMVEQQTRSVLEALEYDFGLAHIEFIETNDGLELVEVNCRMAGALITPSILSCVSYNPYRMAVEQALRIPVMLPSEREIYRGFSHVSIYAERTGTVRAIRGAGELAGYPGEPGWLESRGVGSAIPETETYRARVGNVYATGPTAEIAQDRALCAANCIEVEID